MRILHIDMGEEMRGGQRQVLLLMAGLSEAGHECRLLARKGSPLAAAAIRQGVELRPATIPHVLRQARWADILHAHDARAHSLAALSSRRPFVVSRRVAFPVKSNVLSKWKYSRAARYLPVSRFVQGTLLQAGVAPASLDVVYDAVPAPAFLAEWSPEYPAVALASRDPQKGRPLIEEASRVSGMEVRFSDELTEDFQKCSMFVYISRTEGLGSAALLALSMGVPVIASGAEGLCEVFEHERSGLFVQNDVPSIVRAMRRVLTDRTLTQRMIAEGRVRAQTLFSVKQLTENTVGSYRRALES